VEAKSEAEMLASSLSAAKAEIEASNRRAEMWQTKATLSERTHASETQEHEAANATHKEQLEELRAEVQRAVEDAADARLDAQQTRREVQRLEGELASAQRLLHQYRALSLSIQSVSKISGAHGDGTDGHGVDGAGSLSRSRDAGFGGVVVGGSFSVSPSTLKALSVQSPAAGEGEGGRAGGDAGGISARTMGLRLIGSPAVERARATAEGEREQDLERERERERERDEIRRTRNELERRKERLFVQEREREQELRERERDRDAARELERARERLQMVEAELSEREQQRVLQRGMQTLAQDVGAVGSSASGTGGRDGGNQDSARDILRRARASLLEVCTRASSEVAALHACLPVTSVYQVSEYQSVFILGLSLSLFISLRPRLDTPCVRIMRCMP